MIIIWILYVALLLTVFFSTSCSPRPKYTASKEPVKTEVKKSRQATIVGIHIWCLILSGLVFHITNKDSN